MRVLSSDLDKLTLPPDLACRESALTVGSFDGIHLGHLSLIDQLVAQAKRESRVSGLVTFYPHPASVLHPQQPTLYLTTPGEKTALLEPLGLDWLAVLLFTPELAAMSSRAFVQCLFGQVNMRDLWVGVDFALGHGREGDSAALQSLGDEMGFHVHQVPYVTQDGNKVGSTRIRSLLRHGRVEEAARLLGRCYTVSGEVVRGAQRGRCIGFPTANVSVRPDRVIPANGIYATLAYLGSECYPSVTNVGVRPSFDDGEQSVEAHLLDYEGDLYGCDLVVAFVAYLRAERRYPDIQDLIVQIGRDVEEAREILRSIGKCI